MVPLATPGAAGNILDASDSKSAKTELFEGGVQNVRISLGSPEGTLILR